MQNPQNPQDRERYAAGEALQLTDLVRWGPILAGLFSAMGFLVLSGTLGAAIAVTTVTSPTAAPAVGAAAWAIVSFIIAGFIGGWIASRTLAIGGQLPAVINAVVVWGLLMVVAVYLAVVGAGGLVGGGLGGTGTALGATWSTFIAVVLSLVGAVVGGLVGMHAESEYMSR